MTHQVFRTAEIVVFPPPTSDTAGYRSPAEILEARWPVGDERESRFWRGMAIALSLEAVAGIAMYGAWLALRLFL
jgi:hypothetical protein